MDAAIGARSLRLLPNSISTHYRRRQLIEHALLLNGIIHSPATLKFHFKVAGTRCEPELTVPIAEKIPGGVHVSHGAAINLEEVVLSPCSTVKTHVRGKRLASRKNEHIQIVLLLLTA